MSPRYVRVETTIVAISEIEVHPDAPEDEEELLAHIMKISGQVGKHEPIHPGMADVPGRCKTARIIERKIISPNRSGPAGRVSMAVGCIQRSN